RELDREHLDTRNVLPDARGDLSLQRLLLFVRRRHRKLPSSKKNGPAGPISPTGENGRPSVAAGGPNGPPAGVPGSAGARDSRLCRCPFARREACLSALPPLRAP